MHPTAITYTTNTIPNLNTSHQRRHHRHRTRRTNTSPKRRNRRPRAISTSRPLHRRRGATTPTIILRHHPRPHKHWNNSSSTQTKSPVSHNPQNGRDLPRMRGNRHKRILFPRPREKHFTQCFSASHILRSARLSRNPVPELVFVSESCLDRPLWE